MPWNTLPNYSSGNVPTAAELNNFGGNLDFLHTPIVSSFEQTDESSNLTTTSTAWADISANFSKTFTMSGGYVFCLFSCVASNISIDFNVDGTRRGDATSGSQTWRDATNATMITLPLLLTGLSAASHTISVQWRVPVSGTATIYTAYRPRFYVVQLRGG